MLFIIGFGFMFLIIMATFEQFSSDQVAGYSQFEISYSQLVCLVSLLVLAVLIGVLLIGRVYPRCHFFRFYFDPSKMVYPIYYIVY